MSEDFNLDNEGSGFALDDGDDLEALLQQAEAGEEHDDDEEDTSVFFQGDEFQAAVEPAPAPPPPPEVAAPEAAQEPQAQEDFQEASGEAAEEDDFAFLESEPEAQATPEAPAETEPPAEEGDTFDRLFGDSVMVLGDAPTESFQQAEQPSSPIYITAQEPEPQPQPEPVAVAPEPVAPVVTPGPAAPSPSYPTAPAYPTAPSTPSYQQPGGGFQQAPTEAAPAPAAPPEAPRESKPAVSIHIPTEAEEVSRVARVVRVLDALRKLSQEERQVASQFINEGEVVTEEAVFVVKALNADALLTRTMKAFREAKDLEAVERAFYVIDLEPETLHYLGNLVAVFTGEGFDPSLPHSHFARQVVAAVETLDSKSMSFVKATEAVLSAAEEG